MKSSDLQVRVTMSLDSEQFKRDLKRLHEQTRRAASVPEWCYVPWMRGFIMASALAAPISLLALAFLAGGAK